MTICEHNFKETLRNLFINGHVFFQENCVPKHRKQNIKTKEILKVTTYTSISVFVS